MSLLHQDLQRFFDAQAPGTGLRVWVCDQHEASSAPLLGFIKAHEVVLQEWRSKDRLRPSVILGMHKDVYATELSRLPGAQIGRRLLDWPGCQYLHFSATPEQVAQCIQRAVTGALARLPARVLVQPQDVYRMAHDAKHTLENRLKFMLQWRAAAASASQDPLIEDFAKPVQGEEPSHAASFDRLLAACKELGVDVVLIAALTVGRDAVNAAFIRVSVASSCAVYEPSTESAHAMLKACDDASEALVQQMALIEQIRLAVRQSEAVNP